MPTPARQSTSGHLRPAPDEQPTDQRQPAQHLLTVRYFAAARTAAGVADDVVPAGCTLGTLVAELTERRGERLGTVLAACSFLVDGVACRDRGRRLPATVVVDVLPPFAGG